MKQHISFINIRWKRHISFLLLHRKCCVSRLWGHLEPNEGEFSYRLILHLHWKKYERSTAEDSYQLAETAGAGGTDNLYGRPSPWGDVCFLLIVFFESMGTQLTSKQLIPHTLYVSCQNNNRYRLKIWGAHREQGKPCYVVMITVKIATKQIKHDIKSIHSVSSD